MRVLDWLARFKLTIAYGALMLAVVAALLISVDAQSRIEYQSRQSAHVNCESINETKRVLLTVLIALAESRPDDEPGEFEERQRLLERVRPLIRTVDCPPAPL